MAVILPSVYKDGTATISAGGTAVTGQGTLFTNAVLPGDFFGVHKGFAVRIASVNSNTSLTLANAWPGAAQTAAAYEIMLQSDMARVQESTRQLLEILMGGNLDAFAGLTGAADKLPYFTGAGTMDMADFKAKGRDIIQSSTTATLLARFGPTASRVSPIPSDADVGMVDGDFNTITYPGTYTISGSWANGPPVYGSPASFSTATLEVIARSGGSSYWQYLRNGQSVFRRYASSAGGLSSAVWNKIEHIMVGAVAQSGGVTTGTIFDRGVNSNGEVIKFADGTMINWQRADVSSIPVTTARGSLFGMNSADALVWTYPSSFAAGFHIAAAVQMERGDWAIVTGASLISVSTVSLTHNMWSSVSNPAGNSKTINRIAVGRWF
ncbi:pyocin knob domain-containing protein [Rhizobium giardinii]|uniref:pyocin knob domain-containing protein n=1 Tax=Rhizobium giardinii TaxID=56731 RepID=UPI003D6E4D61